ncbi:hypothetical protein [Streptomyces sp. NBC_00343]|uniref:hypothetical protein n=1 Tax=unclassified Streptomyces TaxID=2593676 RepID=UPI003FA73FEC
MPEDFFSSGDRRSLTTVLAANLLSITGNCLTYMSVPWFVPQSTGSAAKAGIVAFCTLLPVVLTALHMATDYTPYEGIPVTGRPETVVVGDCPGIDAGRLTDPEPRGRHLRSGPLSRSLVC